MRCFYYSRAPLDRREGIPKLRRRARQMAVAVPGEPLESELARLVRTPGQLELDIHAVRILGLKGLR